MFYLFRCGIKNLIKWAPLIYRDYNCDYSPLLEIMEFKLREMSKYYGRKDYLVVDSPKIARETLICAELLKRIREDDIIEESMFGGSNGYILFKTHEMRMRGWKNMFSKLMSRKVQCWWD